MEQYKQRVREYIQAHKTQGILLLKRLVQERSVSKEEGSAQAIIIEKMRELGLTLDIWEPDYAEMKEHPYFISERESFHDSPNVVAIWKGTGGGKSIMLNGHIDVVPEGDVRLWKYDPYGARMIDGKLYGRGATDMKGGSTALIMAIEAVIKSGIRLKGDVCFQSVIEEESGGAGTLAAIMRGYTADAAIIPEPTNMKLFVKQQGSMWFRLVVQGKAAHGGTRYEGVSAIDKAMLVMKHIQQLENRRNVRLQDPLYSNVPIPVPINIGTIHGGNWPSSVPDLLMLEGRYGVAPNETIEQAREEFERWLGELPRVDSWFLAHPVTIEWFGARWLPGSIQEDHPLVTALSHNFQYIERTEPLVEASPWGTDGGLFTYAGIPTMVFGPGETKKAHDHDEYIDIAKVMRAAEIFACLLLDWCEVEL